MTKEHYSSLCATEPTIPVFAQNWWLDAVCGEESWNVVLVEKGNRIVASLPYFLRRLLNQPVITMPKLTQFMGPWLYHPAGQKYANRLSYDMSLLDELIKGLPRVALFQQNFHYSVTNWLPFYWQGFQQTTRYTYVIEELSSENVFSELSSTYRNKIRKAQEIVSVHDDLSISDFHELNKMVFERQNKRIPYTKDFLLRMDQALENNNARKIFYAIDEQKKIHSALYLIWDKTSSYVHMVGEDPELRRSGAGILLVWKAIEYTKQTLNLNRFDFEGSMIKSVEQVRRDFGAKQVPYFQLRKTNFLPFKMALDIRSWLSG